MMDDDEYVTSYSIKLRHKMILSCLKDKEGGGLEELFFFYSQAKA